MCRRCLFFELKITSGQVAGRPTDRLELDRVSHLSYLCVGVASFWEKKWTRLQWVEEFFILFFPLKKIIALALLVWKWKETSTLCRLSCDDVRCSLAAVLDRFPPKWNPFLRRKERYSWFPFSCLFYDSDDDDGDVDNEQRKGGRKGLRMKRSGLIHWFITDGAL